MLHELVKYGESQRLASRPGFAAKRVRWLIVLAENGQFVDVAREDREYPMAPNLSHPQLISGATGSPRSHFVLDTLAVVALYGAVDEIKPKQKHANFVALLHQAAASCPECELCARALEDAATLARIQALLAAGKAKPTDTGTFLVGTRHLPELTAWHDWWADYRASLPSSTKHTTKSKSNRDVKRDSIEDDEIAETDAMVCFVTGETTQPARTHNKVMRIGQMGLSLISFDKDAFGSYGLSQSANAACSAKGMAQYVGAMQKLVDDAPRPLGGMLVLHWYDGPIPDELDLLADLLGSVEETSEEQEKWRRKSDEASAAIRARQVLEAIYLGTRPEVTNRRYFVLQIAPADGRISVRAWFNDDFEELVNHIKAWYSDLEIAGPDGSEPYSPSKLSALLTRLVPFRPNEKGNDLFDRINKQLPPLMPRLWSAILQGAPLPDAMAQAALLYVRSALLRADEQKEIGSNIKGARRKMDAAASGSGGGTTDNLDRIACAILKAWLIRHAIEEKRSIPMDSKVNENHPSLAYHSGRLLAVLAAIQKAALKDVNAGVVQRYYASASRTPALVIGRLVINSQYHLEKIEEKRLANWYQRLMDDIMVKLGDYPPPTLDLEGQTLFALGYYQQRAEMFTKKRIDASESGIANDTMTENTLDIGEN